MLAEALQAEVDAYSPGSPTSATRTGAGWWCATAITSRGGHHLRGRGGGARAAGQRQACRPGNR